ncbi:MAG: gliding motility-associated peptidyl-prolyl isomerase GldI [Flavobacteriaceae bacterium]|nr:gliding motility-associated peptidyl-prolyl isomerase GldI [Flavobacteriaceae bacterium]
MRLNAIYILIAFISLASCKGPEARRPIQQSSGSFYKESAARNSKLYESEKVRITTLMENDPNTIYLSSDSGFWYYYNVQDTLSQTTPEVGDAVRFTYDIKDLAGNTILSETETGIQNYKIDQSNQELISGLRDGLKLMKEGETVTFLFPSYKAFGYYGIENKLGTNVPVQSTVTLDTIIPSKDNQ